MACCQVRSMKLPPIPFVGSTAHCGGFPTHILPGFSFRALPGQNLQRNYQRVGVIQSSLTMGWQQPHTDDWGVSQSARANQNTWMLPNKHQGNSVADECHWQLKIEHQAPKKCEFPSRAPKCSKFHFDRVFLWLLRLVSQMIQPGYIRKD